MWWHYPYFRDKDTQVQESLVTCQKSHSSSLWTYVLTLGPVLFAPYYSAFLKYTVFAVSVNYVDRTEFYLLKINNYWSLFSTSVTFIQCSRVCDLFFDLFFLAFLFGGRCGFNHIPSAVIPIIIWMATVWPRCIELNDFEGPLWLKYFWVKI